MLDVLVELDPIEGDAGGAPPRKYGDFCADALLPSNVGCRSPNSLAEVHAGVESFPLDGVFFPPSGPKAM